MELWYAASLFFGGAFSYWVIAKFMDVTHSYRLMKQVTDQIVLLMISFILGFLGSAKMLLFPNALLPLSDLP